eukprot:1840489-Heterocapsa_arctica.AAC.1
MGPTERVGTDLPADQPRRSAKIVDERASSAAKLPRTAEGPLVPDVLRTPPGLPEQARRTAPAPDE